MSVLWPQLPAAVAASLYQELSSGKRLTPASTHEDQLWSPVGGRVRPADVQRLIEDITGLAGEFGHPEPVGSERRVAFDRGAAQSLRRAMDLDWAEAGRRDVWSFISLIALPEITNWRFGVDNRERWVATDLTRHTWARLWWQAEVFAGYEGLLEALSESDLNQILERRSIGGDARLARALAQTVVTAPGVVPRRYVIRDVSLRLRRLLAFVDLQSLSNEQAAELCQELTQESVLRYHDASDRKGSEGRI